VRRIFVVTFLIACALAAVGTFFTPIAGVLYFVIVPIGLLGFWDMVQTKHSIRRNFPLLGHGRYLMEMVRPEINQYFVESNTDGKPFSREDRSLVYQRAKGELDTVPFGTQLDVYEVGYEWMNHSIVPVHAEGTPRVLIGKTTCTKPYSASLLNVSAMSFGSLGQNAVMALNLGAKEGGFAHNTGEGGISEYHLMGGDVIWQLGTGYFGARAADGSFDPDRFVENATKDEVKMIEVKLSQGAKPGHGGILPAKKLTLEIAQIRGVPMGQDVISPPAHRAFDTPIGLLEFIARLRHLSGGKPVGFKLCVGKRRELMAIMKAILETGIHPDYIAVDGGEGGTGAAPLEFSNTLGCPLTEGLIFVHNALTGIGYRDRVKVIASGKIVSGFHMARAIALGADACYSARAMMLALGCIQARRCNSNDCPTGVATQRPELMIGLVVKEKAPRVARYQRETVESMMDLIGAAGLSDPHQLRPWHIFRRVSRTEVEHYGEMYDHLEDGALLGGAVPASYARAWSRAAAHTFAPQEPLPESRAAVKEARAEGASALSGLREGSDSP
jgi:glutamate synthase domain-containing protein 2